MLGKEAMFSNVAKVRKIPFSYFFLKLFNFCQPYFHFLLKSLWKNSLRPLSAWLFLPIQRPIQFPTHTVGGAVEQTSVVR